MVPVNGMQKRDHVREAFDRVAPVYDDMWTDSRSVAENQIVFNRLIREYPVMQGRMLEIGSGTGLLLDYLSPWIAPSCYVGVDVSEQMILQANKKHPRYMFRQMDADEFRYFHSDHERPAWFRDFDSVVSTFASWSYLVSPRLVLRSLFDVMNPGARVLLMPYGPGEDGNSGYYADDSGTMIPRVTVTKSDMYNLLKFVGFTKINVMGLTSTRAARAFAAGRYKNQTLANARLYWDFTGKCANDDDNLFTIGIAEKPL